MIRWSLFVVLALAVVAYSFWLYLRVELTVRAARRLATARAATMLVLVMLLFDVRLPAIGAAGAPARWVLLDASLSMGAVTAAGSSAWQAAAARAMELERDGWTVVTFGSETMPAGSLDERAPEDIETLLAPALERAVEAGAREVRVLSDLRFEDAVAVRSALASLPLEFESERFGEGLVNAGISSFVVPDLARPEGSVTAEIEVHGGEGEDSLAITIQEEDREVARVTVAAPSPGLASRARVELPTPGQTGRLRYTASVDMEDDAFSSDDAVVSYASVGHQEGALVLLSLRADWEPRYLLPVVEDVTGLTGLGYLRTGPDSFVRMGAAVDRGGPVDSISVRRAAASATLLVMHGLGADADAWVRSLLETPGRALVLPSDEEGAAMVGLATGEPREGEWYVSSEIPSSPIAGALTGATIQGLPPLTDLLLPTDPSLVRGPLLAQLRGAGPLEAALHLDDRPQGRVAVVLGSGFWRWAARESGREAYRRLWSGVAGWLLAADAVVTLEPRPAQWVVGRGQPVVWNLPVDDADRRILVSRGDSVVVDTTLTGGGPTVTGVLPPGHYSFRIERGTDDEAATGRFDVAEATLEMRPAAVEPEAAAASAGGSGATIEERPGRPLRTRPWPYLLVITLLCAEWIGRRRSGLR